ncbi:MAG: hypothetical protein IT215_07440 [Chitinophagaceae bacterium]|nr:MAG: hypothetical protein UZ11_BCD004000063 [Bacteroidetes bacterium OLB11]MCC6448502.1 hypothetical protein [Chitinophagaceae bacterium]HMN33002.1 DUF6048 family protein [Chitinophagaceae bacterium]
MRNTSLYPIKKTVLLSILLVLVSNISAFAKQKDTIDARFDFYRIGIDISKIPASILNNDYNAYEFTFDVHYKRDLFLEADFGFGNSNTKNLNLNFDSKNAFVRFGIDKTFFSKDYKGDFDNAFVGLRYAASYINRSVASYFIKDTVWGSSSGNISEANLMAHWVELIGGFKVELKKHLFLGWNVRFKALLSAKKIQELPPNYIAGYGRGEKNTAFGYNLYLLYGFGKRE